MKYLLVLILGFAAGIFFTDSFDHAIEPRVGETWQVSKDKAGNVRWQLVVPKARNRKES